ncbi:MAG: hypothetical protein K5872_22725 [Rhizobiaceae bacterium]|nr:hypothetical protein [Rhizobiaceae bacterium]MCV0409037.1 hypothetical protein [Rhizobiaceae bacterium]
MRKLVLAASVAAVAALAGCTTTEQDAALGGVAGAAIGGLATGSAEGAVLGGVAGAATGALVSRASRRGWCRYRDEYGDIYEARCPRGY